MGTSPLPANGSELLDAMSPETTEEVTLQGNGSTIQDSVETLQAASPPFSLQPLEFRRQWAYLEIRATPPDDY